MVNYLTGLVTLRLLNWTLISKLQETKCYKSANMPGQWSLMVNSYRCLYMQTIIHEQNSEIAVSIKIV